MRRREQREHVFKLMFMTEFNSEEEMTEQLSLYFEGLGELSEHEPGIYEEEICTCKGASGRYRCTAEQCKPWMEDQTYEPCGSRSTSPGSIRDGI